MNGDPNLDEFEPSFLMEGNPLSGFEPAQPPFFEDATEYDTEARTILNPEEDFIPAGGGCLADAGDPPGSGTYVLGSVNGTCQWIDTTTCA